MTGHCKSLVVGLLCIAALPLLAQAGGTPSSGENSTKATKQDRSSAAHQSDGERKFAQNCGRCHTPPESFSPHISRTIVLHMRVRASLSKQDEEEILHFLNP